MCLAYIVIACQLDLDLERACSAYLLGALLDRTDRPRYLFPVS